MTNKFFTISIPILLLIIASFYFTSKFIQPSVKKEITIATGSIDGEYYKTALQYKELLEKQKVKVNIITSNGSLENIELLNEKNNADCIVPALNVTDTVIYGNNTINRENVKLIQTPQLSNTDVLKNALNTKIEFTDESSAIKAKNGTIKYNR